MRVKHPFRRLLALAVAVTAPALWAAESLSPEAFLNQIQNENAEQRRQAFEQAGPQGAQAVIPLAGLIVGGEREGAADRDRDVAKAAGRALELIAHHASRHGADAERAAVASELAKLLTSESEGIRSKALELLASAATDETVPAVAALLNNPNPQMRERARWALERIAAPAATEALLKALPSAEGEFRRDLILTLGVKKAQSAVEPLLLAARSGDEQIRFAAVEALARIGDPQAFQPVLEALMALQGWHKLQAQDDFLRLADAIAADNPPMALAMYRGVLERSQSQAGRAAAVVGAGKLGAPESLTLLIGGLGDNSARVRNAALSALAGLKGAEADQRIIAAAREAQPAARAALLRVLAGRESPGAQQLIKDAANDPNAEIKVTALSLLGGLDDPALEQTLLQAAEQGSEQVRPVALMSYLQIADKRAAENKDQALAMYHRALDLASSNDVRARALQGLAALARPESLERVEKLLAERGVYSEAAQAYISIVAAQPQTGPKDDAINRLGNLVAETRSAGVATRAIRELKALGADTTGFAAKAGFIPRWWLLGPVPSDAPNPFEQAGATIDPAKPVEIAGRTYQWKEYATDDPRGVVNLNEALQRGENVAAYAYRDFTAPRSREANLLVGSDDGVIVWLDGKEVHNNAGASRAVSVDEDKIRNVQIAEGPNQLLLKVAQGGGDWGFVVRLANTQNRPLDITGWGLGVKPQGAAAAPAPEKPAPEQPAPEQPAPEQPAPEKPAAAETPPPAPVAEAAPTSPAESAVLPALPPEIPDALQARVAGEARQYFFNSPEAQKQIPTPQEQAQALYRAVQMLTRLPRAESLATSSAVTEIVRNQMLNEYAGEIYRRKAGDVQVAEEDIKKLYQENIERFAQPGRFWIRHVFLNTVDNPGREAEKEALAQKALKEIEAGASFTEVARKYSDVEDKKEEVVGPLKYGEINPELEAEVLKLEPGRHTGVIKSKWGFNIFLLDKHEPPTTQSLEAVRGQVEEQALNQKRGAAYKEVHAQIEAQLSAETHFDFLTPDAPDTTVLARAEFLTITAGDYRKRVQSLPPQVQGRFNDPDERTAFLERWIETERIGHLADQMEIGALPQMRVLRNWVLHRAVADALLVQLLTDVPAPTPDEVRKFYEENRQYFEKPAEARVRELVLSYRQPPNTTPREYYLARKEAEAKAREVLGKLRAGADFVELVKQYSTSGTRDKDGDLGFMFLQKLGRETAETLEKLPPGQHSDLIDANEAFSIYKIEERKTAELAPLDERTEAAVRGMVVRQKRAQRGVQILLALAEAWKPGLSVEEVRSIIDRL